jgi:processive 1,2-diacylglycerol beta-glucosyltransferase
MDVVLLTTSTEGDRRRVAQAVEDRLKSAHPEITVESVDFFERFAPNLSVLGRFAYRQQPGFFPEGRGPFADLARRHPDHPLVRELERSGLERVQAYLEEGSPSAILSLHPAAALAAAEVGGAAGDAFRAALIDDWAPAPYWQHPDTDHYFVASEDVRADLVAKGLPWGSAQVVGVPLPPAFDALPAAGEARRAASLPERFTVLVRAESLAPGDTAEMVRGLAAGGLGVVVLAGTDAAARRVRESANARGVEVAGSGADVPRLLAASDVVVQPAGGIAMAEALAAGRPQILLGEAPAEEAGDVEFLVDHGAAMAAPAVPSAVRKAVFLAHHPGRLQEIAADGRTLVFPGAAKQVAERIAGVLAEPS